MVIICIVPHSGHFVWSVFLSGLKSMKLPEIVRKFTHKELKAISINQCNQDFAEMGKQLQLNIEDYIDQSYSAILIKDNRNHQKTRPCYLLYRKIKVGLQRACLSKLELKGLLAKENLVC